MLTRDKVLGMAADACMEELYSLVQPKVDWADFVTQNEIYSNKYKVWERFNYLYHKENKTKEELKEYSTFPVAKWKGKSITECIGPKPYEFYYIPRNVMKIVCDNYIHAYRIDSQQNLLNIIEVLKNYCKEPIKDKYIDEYTDENGNHHPGYRGYEHPDNLQKEISKIINNYSLEPTTEDSEDVVEICNKFFGFLDAAGDFFNWNRDLNAFNCTVYLGASPNTNKEAVIKNWKEYRNQDIQINDEEYDEFLEGYYD